MSDWHPDPASVRDAYKLRFDRVLTQLAVELEDYIKSALEGQHRIDRISVRPKSVDSYVRKALKQNDDGQFKYKKPLVQIQDQIGARIVTFFKSDVDRIGELISKEFRAIEEESKEPSTDWEFGYFGQHRILLIPTDVKDASWPDEQLPRVFELQIKTLFQHAWSEAEHDLGYKEQSAPLSSEQKRLLAFTSAQAWGADRIFDELAVELRSSSET